MSESASRIHTDRGIALTEVRSWRCAAEGRQRADALVAVRLSELVGKVVTHSARHTVSLES